MNARDEQLRGNHQQHRAGQAKKFPQVDFETAFEETYAQQRREPQARQAANEVHELGRAERDDREEQHGLNALAENHQKNEEEDAGRSNAAWLNRKLRKPRFDVLLQALSRLPHPRHHGRHQNSPRKHQPSFVRFFGKFQTVDDIGGGEARHRRCS